MRREIVTSPIFTTIALVLLGTKKPPRKPPRSQPPSDGAVHKAPEEDRGVQLPAVTHGCNQGRSYMPRLKLYCTHQECDCSGFTTRTRVERPWYVSYVAALDDTVPWRNKRLVTPLDMPTGLVQESLPTDEANGMHTCVQQLLNILLERPLDFPP